MSATINGKNAAAMFYGGQKISSAWMNGQRVWSGDHPLEQGTVWEVLTPKPSGSSTSMRITDYPAAVGIGDRVIAEGTAQVGGGYSKTYHSLSLHVNTSTTSYGSGSAALISKTTVPVSRDIMLTCTLPGELGDLSVAKIYRENRNFILGTQSHFVLLDHKLSACQIVTPAGETGFEFPKPLNTVGRIGDLRFRLTGGRAQVYLDSTLLADTACPTPQESIGKLIIFADDISYNWSLTGVWASGGPAVSNFCYYTGQESANRAAIWGLE